MFFFYFFSYVLTFREFGLQDQGLLRQWRIKNIYIYLMQPAILPGHEYFEYTLALCRGNSRLRA